MQNICHCYAPYPTGRLRLRNGNQETLHGHRNSMNQNPGNSIKVNSLGYALYLFCMKMHIIISPCSPPLVRGDGDSRGVNYMQLHKETVLPTDYFKNQISPIDY
ncbi:hypothetical protein Cal7507_4396 [Calothrix sp. PCC 7507]|nr:hypothetical protein Cal7507_4396 [Calothrix sp. PCC 7507]